jgi:Protein ChrB, N-terminal
VATERVRWVFLAYRLPREPSTPRISVWRKLRRLGAAQLLDGLVALPADARTKEQFEWVADEIVDAGGEASLWLAEAADRAVEQELTEQIRSRAAEEYRTVMAELEDLGDDVSPRTLGRLRRELQRIGHRDFFPPPERDAAHRAVTEAARQERVQ